MKNRPLGLFVFMPTEVAAWVEYNIDLSGHFFADGCGKIAKAVSSWVLMRAGYPLPDYSMNGKIPADSARAIYYSNAPKTIPGTNPEMETTEFINWIKHYLNYAEHI